uniref:Adenosine 5'-monophosphoramidase HINT3 n=1 Tax=Timema tahoe TaxID=61484 RepID=A0A7R9FEZ5_9NEOP|nr:unnamed protein product [Timema tahoe]
MRMPTLVMLDDARGGEESVSLDGVEAWFEADKDDPGFQILTEEEIVASVTEEAESSEDEKEKAGDTTQPTIKDDNYVAFSDIKPASKYHYLIIPKQHISDVKSLVPEQNTLVEDLVRIAKQILEQTGVDLSDVRFGFHWPPFHSISHLHLHAIAPASQMGFISRGIFKPDSWWFVTKKGFMEF